MAKQSKVIHLIKLYGYRCKSTCSYCNIEPIEATIVNYKIYNASKGTFNPQKVTCKRCLKHPDYKDAMDKINYPLFSWKENI
jgi:hypothetical protein